MLSFFHREHPVNILLESLVITDTNVGKTIYYKPCRIEFVCRVWYREYGRVRGKGRGGEGVVSVRVNRRSRGEGGEKAASSNFV